METFLIETEKQLLLDRYFDIEWVDDVTDLRCVRCHRVAIDHCVSSCQHIFCINCSKFYGGEDQLDCPQCQERISQPDNLDFEVEIKIHQLKMFCPNKKYGCNYAVQVRKIPSHLLVCVHTRKAAAALPVETPVTNTIAEVVNQLTNLNSAIGEIKEGLREIKEGLREMKDKVNQLEKKSDDTDSKINASMNEDKKNEDELRSMRSQLESVIQVIQQSELLHRPNKDLNMDEMKAKLDQMPRPNKILPNKKPEEVNHQKAESYEWTIKDVEKNILNDNTAYESEVFKFAGCKYDVKARIDHHDGLFWISLQFIDGDKINHLLDNDVFTIVTYIIKDQINDSEKKDILCKVYLRNYDGYGISPWIFKDLLLDETMAPVYVNNDCMKVTILFEPSSIDDDFVSDNGTLQWTLDNYEQRKKDQKLEYIWSPPFYTSPKGYRVRIKLSIHDSQSISVDVHFLTGEHDAALSPVFFHKTTVTLVNQKNAAKNLVMTKESDVTIQYAIHLKTRQSIERSGFIQDDSLLLKVVIASQL